MASTRDKAVSDDLDADESSTAAPPPLASERLEYVAAMILELKHLAEKSGCQTLAGILALAHVEALQQSSAERKN